VASWASLGVGFVVFLAQDFVPNVEVSTDYHLFAHRTLLGAGLEVFLADGQPLMDQVLPSHCLAANLALDALRVVGFLPQLDTVPFDQVLADDAGVLEFRVIFWAVGFPASLEEFALDFLLADAALEALFVVHLAKCSAALICHGLVTNLAFSDGFVDGFGEPSADSGLNLRVVESWVGRH